MGELLLLLLLLLLVPSQNIVQGVSKVVVENRVLRVIVFEGLLLVLDRHCCKTELNCIDL